jgi:hypothetical protein
MVLESLKYIFIYNALRIMNVDIFSNIHDKTFQSITLTKPITKCK